MKPAIPFIRLLFTLLFTLAVMSVLIQKTAHAEGRRAIPLRDTHTAVFTENRGQVFDTDGRRRDDIRYYASFPGMTVYFRKSGFSYVFTQQVREDDTGADHEAGGAHDCTIRSGVESIRQFRTDMEFILPSPRCRLEGEGEAGNADRFYKGGGAIPILPVSWTRLRYRDIYPSTDLVFFFSEGKLKYDFVLRPGAGADNIAIRVIGAENVLVSAEGGLRISTPLGIVSEQKPVAFLNGPESASAEPGEAPNVHFRIDGDTFGFVTSGRDPSVAMTIDPAIEWSTYLGGQTADYGLSTATDAAGNVIVAGWTSSTDFPVSPGALQTTKGGNEDAFLAKFTPDGTRIWITYFGGSTVDLGTSVAVNRASEITICGYTYSDDFPVRNGFQPARNGNGEGFVAKFLPDGQLQWSTFLGGNNLDECHDIAIGPNGAIHVTGRTESVNFPTTFGAVQFLNGGGMDAFVVKFSPEGNRLWGTYLGHLDEEWGHSIAVDRDSNIVVCGHTHSSKFFTTPGAYQPTWNWYREGFVVRFTPAGGRVYSSYIGGDYWDDAYAITVDNNKSYIVTGGTESNDFSTSPGAFKRTRDSIDVFIIKFDSSGVRSWCTLYGGTGKDIGNGVAAFPSGNLAVTGGTTSLNFPVTFDAAQSTSGGQSDAFVLKLSGNGARKWSSYIGGEADDNAETDRGLASVTMDRKGSVVITGWTASKRFPVVKPHQTANGGSWDAFITKFECPLVPPVSISASGPTSFCEGDSVVLDAGPGYASYLWTTGETGQSITVTQSGVYSVLVTDTNDCADDSRQIAVTVFPLPRPMITTLGPTVFCEDDSVLLDAGIWSEYRWSNGRTERFVTIKAPGPISVTVKDSNGCEATAPALDIIVNRRPAPVITPRGPTTFCSGDSVLLDAGSGYIRYRWSTGDTTSQIIVRQSGSYQVTVTNLFDCDGTSPSLAVVVNPRPSPVITAQGPTVFCEGDSVVLDAGAGYKTYLWSTGEATRMITVRSSGIFGVTVTNDFDCAATVIGLQVTVNPNPVTAITALGPTVFCEGGSVTLDAGAGFARYRWSNGDTTRTIVARSSGAYSVTVSFATGCFSTAGPVLVTAFPNPAPVVTADGPLAFCEGDSVTLSAPQGFVSYAWNNGATTRSITVKASGMFTVTVIDTNTCTATSQSVIVTVYPNPAVPVVRQARDTLISTPEYGYQWYRDGIPIAGETSQRLLIPRSGDYTVVVTNREGCSARSLPLSVVIALTTLELPVIQAAPGERVTIPLTIRSSEWLAQSGAKSFVGTIGFSKSLLVPIASTAQWSIAGNRRIGVFQGSWADTVGVLASVDCIAMLGDEDSTILSIDAFEWTSGAVRVIRINGLFRLVVCHEGGDRMFDGSVRAMLVQNRPNPFNALTTIGFGVMESGRAEVTVHDMLGRKVATVFDEFVEPGFHSAVFDASSLPSGQYMYMLRSGSVAITRMMLLLK